MKHHWKDLSIRIKFAAVCSAIVMSSFAAFTLITVSSVMSESETTTRAALTNQADQMRDMLDAYDSALRQSTELASRMFAAEFQNVFSMDEAMPMKTGGAEAPAMRAGGNVLNNDTDIVDRYTAKSGAVATVFARRGDQLIRISTSLKKEDGNRAMGTALDTTHPAHAKLLAGEAYTGKARLFGRDYMTRYVPARDAAGKVVGALFVGLDFTEGLKALVEKVKSLKVGETGYFFVIDATAGKQRGNVLIHPTQEGKNALDVKDADGNAFVKNMLDSRNGLSRYRWQDEEAGKVRDKFVVYRHFPAWDWVIAGGSYADEFTRAADKLRLVLLALGISAVVLLSITLHFTFKSLVLLPLKKVGDVASHVAHGDLTTPIEVKSADEMGDVMASLKAMNENLSTIVSGVRRSTETIEGAATEIASGNADLSHRTEEQASSLEETASSMEELTSTVRQNAEHAREANELAAGASSVASRGGKAVGEVVKTMASINESSKRISEIIAVIDGIAFQTNILALNAAVEAARAGEQGRGFAVVASEVRNLAQRSASAAREIKALIGDSVSKVEDGAKLVDEAGKTMNEVVGSVKRVADIMADISAASQEQSSGIEQVNQAVMHMDDATQQNAALVEQAAAAAESLQMQSRQLSEAVAVFKVVQTERAGQDDGEAGSTPRVAALHRDDVVVHQRFAQRHAPSPPAHARRTEAEN